jgi:predicted aldo/keto reductase-like oxidoreductase
MQYYNNKILFNTPDADMKKGLAFQHDWGMLAKTDVRAGACIECGRCEEECTQHLPIIERLKDFARLEAELKAEKAAADKQ